MLVGRDAVAAPTGHDRTTIVCFQDADRPGSLYAILGRFAARDINLTKLESRPTKRGLGDYCFVIEFEGHVADDVVADCLADLQAHLARVKFLGSYPVTGQGATDRRTEVVEARKSADEWIRAIQTGASFVATWRIVAAARTIHRRRRRHRDPRAQRGALKVMGLQWDPTTTMDSSISCGEPEGEKFKHAEHPDTLDGSHGTH